MADKGISINQAPARGALPHHSDRKVFLTDLEQLLAAFELISDVVAISSLYTGKIVAINRAFEIMHGVTMQNVVGRIIGELDLWVKDEQRREFVALTLKHQCVKDFSAQIYDRDRQVRDVRMNAMVVAQQEESYLIVTVRDVTEVRRTRAVLQQAQTRLSYLFETSPMPMAYLIGEDVHTTRYNAAWFATFGFDPAKHQGKSGLELGIWVNPEDRQRAIEMARAQGETGEMEVQMRHADGSLHWIALRVRLQEDLNQTLLLFSYVDVTQRRQAQEQLQTMNAQLGELVETATRELKDRNQALNATVEELRRTQLQLIETEKVAALGTLVTGLSHEINTPIGNSLLMSTTIESRFEKFAQQRAMQKPADVELLEFLDHAMRVAQTLTRNVTKVSELISAFKQVAQDRPTEQRCLFTVETLFEGVQLAVQDISKRTQCPVQIDLADTAQINLYSYPAPMMAAIGQIVENCMVHGYQNGKLQGPVRVTVKPQGSELLVQVTDYGIGIPQDRIGRVFDPFFTTQLGKTGSGLGLSIVQRNVRRVLGGNVQVFSNGPMHGARFDILIPVQAPG